MRRKIDNVLFEDLQKELSSTSGKKWQTYQCTLVTPMYGGGVKAGEVDKDMPIRASSIRGQLRFWWRIACGPFNSTKEMFDRETAIWGGIGNNGATASQVEIRVKPLDLSNYSVKTVDEFKRQSAIGIKYVLGSVNGPSAKLPSILKKEKKEKEYFELDIYCPELVKPDVDMALRWWASFGGIGAKVRRGFGAVNLKGIDSIPLSYFDGGQTSNGCQLEFINKQYDTAIQAWEAANEQLYNYRQKPTVGRKQQGTGKAGRSFWPEADQLRHLTGKNDNGRHMPEFEKNLIFPRAAFGLPIKFQFPGKNDEPYDMTLQLIDSERMASPVIIRPYKEGEKWRAAALLLPKWQDALVEELELSPSPSNTKPKSWPTSPQERHELAQKIEPMKGRGDDPLSAFLEYFKEGNL